MTKINFIVDKKNHIKKASLEGHVGYAEMGRDILCASISSTVQFALNGISIYGKEKDLNISINEKDAIIKIDVLRYNKNNDILLGSLRDGYKTLSEQFPKFISYREEVVEQ